MKHDKRGIARITAAFRNSRDGIRAAWKNEEAFRQEAVLCLLLLPICFILDVSIVERLVLIWSLVFIIFAELVNTSIEVTIDRIGLETHHLSKMAKDIGSAIVLLSFVWAAAAWAMILFK